jgi:antitoxin HicB
MNPSNGHYSLIIEWSDEDQCYLVKSPEWADRFSGPIAEGQTVEEAAKRGQNALENMIEFAQERNLPLPAPHMAQTA